MPAQPAPHAHTMCPDWRSLRSAFPLSQKALKPGDFLWELIHPKDKDGSIQRVASGKYRVRLFVVVSGVAGRGTGA